MTWSDARGSATLELAVVAPGLLALLGLVIVAGRITAAGSAVEQAAAAGARAASLARDARAAEVAADQQVAAALRDQGVRCEETSTRVDTRGFAARVGLPATVSVAVQCVVPLRDVAVPGMPGQRTLTARATSPLDTYRGRG
jgi:Flp pilus assembly protein TadG